jgi:hypothetical protein
MVNIDEETYVGSRTGWFRFISGAIHILKIISGGF